MHLDAGSYVYIYIYIFLFTCNTYITYVYVFIRMVLWHLRSEFPGDPLFIQSAFSASELRFGGSATVLRLLGLLAVLRNLIGIIIILG